MQVTDLEGMGHSSLLQPSIYRLHVLYKTIQGGVTTYQIAPEMMNTYMYFSEHVVHLVQRGLFRVLTESCCPGSQVKILPRAFHHLRIF